QLEPDQPGELGVVIEDHPARIEQADPDLRVSLAGHVATIAEPSARCCARAGQSGSMKQRPPDAVRQSPVTSSFQSAIGDPDPVSRWLVIQCKRWISRRSGPCSASAKRCCRYEGGIDWLNSRTVTRPICSACSGVSVKR